MGCALIRFLFSRLTWRLGGERNKDGLPKGDGRCRLVAVTLKWSFYGFPSVSLTLTVTDPTMGNRTYNRLSIRPLFRTVSVRGNIPQTLNMQP